MWLNSISTKACLWHFLDVRPLLYFNVIVSVGGLEALKKLQSLWIDHNQLTSTRGLTEAFTLHLLDLSHNHVTRVEGLDNCALLRTLRLTGNTLTEVGQCPSVPVSQWTSYLTGVGQGPSAVEIASQGRGTLPHDPPDTQTLSCVLARLHW